MSFSDKARKHSGPRTPVRDAVQPHLPDIIEAIDAGASLSGTYKALRADGHEVGRSPSSFRNALKALENEIEEIRASKGIPKVSEVAGDAGDPEGSSSCPAPDRGSNAGSESDPSRDAGSSNPIVWRRQ